MSAWRPLKRREFIRRRRAVGFDGLYSGTRDQFMTFGAYRQTVSSNTEYSVPQLQMLLRQVEAILEREISVEDWEDL
jgi:hypothetical protein